MTTTTNADELERTIASDPVLAEPLHAATLKLARDLAAELDAQLATGSAQTRTQATYSGQLAAIRRIVRDDRERRRKERGRPPAEGSRLAHIQRDAARITAG
jgi:hypothetical protein